MRLSLSVESIFEEASKSCMIFLNNDVHAWLVFIAIGDPRMVENSKRLIDSKIEHRKED